MSIKTIMGVCLCCIMLVGASSLMFAGENILFYDDFSSNPEENWTRVSANEGEEWIWDEDAQTFAVHIDYPADNLQIAGDDNWTDYAVEIRLQSSMGHRWGILFRGTYVDDEVVGIVLWSGDMHLFVQDFPAWGEIGDMAKTITFDEAGRPSLAFQADVWYVVRLEVRGNNVTVIVNDEELGDVDFEGFEKGFVGLYSFVEGSNTFDYVKVTEL